MPQSNLPPDVGRFRQRRRANREGTPSCGSSLRAQLPALLCGIVLRARLHPTLAFRRFFALPKWRIGLKPIDQKMTGGERRLTMRRSGRDEYDAVAGFEPAVTVDDQYRVERPAPVRLCLDLSEFSLGHPRVVLEGQRGNPVAAANISYQSDKACSPADPMIAGGKALEFSTDIKIFTLHADHRLSLRSPAGR